MIRSTSLGSHQPTGISDNGRPTRRWLTILSPHNLKELVHEGQELEGLYLRWNLGHCSCGLSEYLEKSYWEIHSCQFWPHQGRCRTKKWHKIIQTGNERRDGRSKKEFSYVPDDQYNILRLGQDIWLNNVPGGRDDDTRRVWTDERTMWAVDVNEELATESKFFNVARRNDKASAHLNFESSRKVTVPQRSSSTSQHLGSSVLGLISSIYQGLTGAPFNA